MDPATPNGETPGTTDPKTNANPPAPAQPTAAELELERVRKEAEQATMRANQLANQLKEKVDAEAAAEAARLEQQNEFKTLYEQEQAKRRELEAAQERATRESAVRAEREKVLADYPSEVRTLADEVGLSLADTDEDTVAAYKAKLDKIQGTIKVPKVTANNPGTSNPASELSGQDIHEIMRDPVKFQEYLQKNYTGIAAMTKPRA